MIIVLIGIAIILLISILFILVCIALKISDIRNLLCNISYNSDSIEENILKIYLYYRYQARGINGISLDKLAKEYLNAKDHVEDIINKN